tara:strand:+ start:521 stop:1423 length:903 start_codon:yes stop_codon:yes gene_type:complete
VIDSEIDEWRRRRRAHRDEILKKAGLPIYSDKAAPAPFDSYGSSGSEGYVYIMRSRTWAQGTYKVGLSSDPERRVKEISHSTNMAYPAMLVKSWWVLDMRSAEAEAHRRLRLEKHGARKEFFRGPLRDIERIVGEVCDTYANREALARKRRAKFDADIERLLNDEGRGEYMIALAEAGVDMEDIRDKLKTGVYLQSSMPGYRMDSEIALAVERFVIAAFPEVNRIKAFKKAGLDPGYPRTFRLHQKSDTVRALKRLRERMEYQAGANQASNAFATNDNTYIKAIFFGMVVLALVIAVLAP